jgi:formiminoglutamate deiminase
MSGLFFAHALLPDGWARDVRLVIDGGIITEVHTDTVVHADDERHSIVLPGLDNAHSHVFQRALSGRTEWRRDAADSFWTWREELYAVALRMTPDALESIAAYSYAQMLESGFTRVGEFHYLHHAPDGSPYAAPAETSLRIVDAAAESGIRLTLLPVFYAHSGFGALPPRDEQRRFICDEALFARIVESVRPAVGRLPGGRLGVAPHSLRAVTPGELRRVSEAFAGLPKHIHAAEQPREVEECEAALGVGPLEWLVGEFGIDRSWTLVHATHASAQGLRAVAASGAVICVCPITEANLGDGIFNGREAATGAVPLAVGSDSNVVIDAAGELRLLEYSQRLRDGRRNVFGDAAAATAEVLLTRVLRGGRRSLGVGETGLEAGAPADFFTLPEMLVEEADGNAPRALNLWVFGTRDPRAGTVWTDGRKRVVEGRHLQADGLRRRFLHALRAVLSD